MQSNQEEKYTYRDIKGEKHVGVTASDVFKAFHHNVQHLKCVKVSNGECFIMNKLFFLRVFMTAIGFSQEDVYNIMGDAGTALEQSHP